MKNLDFSRYMLGSCAAVALLAGCGGSQPPVGAPGAITQSDAKHSRTFHFTGHKEVFRVPAGVTAIRITADGASGGSSQSTSGDTGSGYTGGDGGRVKATIPVTPGERLVVVVGGEGGAGGTASGSNGGAGAFNGGAEGGFGRDGASGDGGGGASDVRQDGDALIDRVVVAGGGGGAGAPAGYGSYSGGVGGGRAGGAGGGGCYSGGANACGGRGGSQHAGGRGGKGGTRGGFQKGRHGLRGTLSVGGVGGGCVDSSSFCEAYDAAGGAVAATSAVVAAVLVLKVRAGTAAAAVEVADRLTSSRARRWSKTVKGSRRKEMGQSFSRGRAD